MRGGEGDSWRRIVTAILGGGQGSRLWPLTRDRAKPAVPVGGKFRLIDIPISNSLHAGIDRIFVITQFNSASLHRHIAQTYRFSAFSNGYVNILAAEQTLDNRDWFQGTADAVRQTLPRLLEANPNEVLILSGDQLYLMDIAKFVRTHREREADLTIAVKLVTREEASGFGILRLDATGRIVDFVEKPKEAEQLDAIELDEQTRAVLGAPASAGSFLASMGIYIFRPEVLSELLVGTDDRRLRARGDPPGAQPVQGRWPSRTTATGPTSAPSRASTRRTSTSRCRCRRSTSTIRSCGSSPTPASCRGPR